MFTGIITDIGTLLSVTRNADTRMVIGTSFDMSGVALGASIACSGACLTVVEKQRGSFAVDVSNETLACTTLGDWAEGHKINLEQALKVGDELGGHFVSGHVDAVAHIQTVEVIEGSHKVTVAIPDGLARYIAPKGSITLDGVSLTVNEADDAVFAVNIIPHTWSNTTFSGLQPGSKVNLEIDLLARYVLR